MLDVHPPHHAANTWRDFFIHIATIVVGLLIAIGLEQGVEWISHKHEIKETRQALIEERAQNVTRFHTAVHYARLERAELENNLRIFQFLQMHPGTDADKLPGVLRWNVRHAETIQTSWNSARQSNVLGLMPTAEIEEYRSLYEELDMKDARELAIWNAFNEARNYEFVQPEIAKLTPAQIDAEIPLLTNCLRLTYQATVNLNNIGEQFADFAPGPSDLELDSFRHEGGRSHELASPADAFTQRDLDQAKSLDALDQPETVFVRRITEQGGAQAAVIYRNEHDAHPNFKPGEDFLNSFGYNLLRRGDAHGATGIF